jgi:hypothetical protein
VVDFNFASIHFVAHLRLLVLGKSYGGEQRSVTARGNKRAARRSQSLTIVQKFDTVATYQLVDASLCIIGAKHAQPLG